MLETSIDYFTTYHLSYKKKLGISKSAHNLYLFQSLYKLLSLSNSLFDYIIKFVTYYPYYKNKFEIIE